MGSAPILLVKRSVSISTMINLNGDGHNDVDGIGRCKQNLRTPDNDDDGIGRCKQTFVMEGLLT